MGASCVAHLVVVLVCVFSGERFALSGCAVPSRRQTPLCAPCGLRDAKPQGPAPGSSERQLSSEDFTAGKAQPESAGGARADSTVAVSWVAEPSIHLEALRVVARGVCVCSKAVSHGHWWSSQRKFLWKSPARRKLPAPEPVACVWAAGGAGASSPLCPGGVELMCSARCPLCGSNPPPSTSS